MYTLIRPANHFASRLPSLPGALVYKLVSPRLAPSRIAEFLLAAGDEPIDTPIEPGFEHFVYDLGTGGFAYWPDTVSFRLQAEPGGRVLWLRRRYEPWPGIAAPEPISNHRDAVTATPTGTPGLLRAELLPARDPSFDFNMTLMRFDPGVGLPQVEIHDEEHGLYMTAGGGDYRLGDDVHPVAAHDFIYMAPYCPQGFAAGDAGAEYLLYKDVYRDSI